MVDARNVTRPPAKIAADYSEGLQQITGQNSPAPSVSAAVEFKMEK
jgi:hypothetical protein